jgi:hypothetical protein
MQHRTFGRSPRNQHDEGRDRLGPAERTAVYFARLAGLAVKVTDEEWRFTNTETGAVVGTWCPASMVWEAGGRSGRTADPIKAAKRMCAAVEKGQFDEECG